MNVSAVIVTRGDVPLGEILDSMPRKWEKVVWDNSKRADLSVYGRYAAIAECEHDVIFVQDDDCVLAPESFVALLDAYEPGAVACNMPERFRHSFYENHALVGFGALFDSELPARAFERFYAHPDADRWMRTLGANRINRTADIIFTCLSERVLVDAPYTNLPWAEGSDRMYRGPHHIVERAAVLDAALLARGEAAA